MDALRKGSSARSMSTPLYLAFIILTATPFSSAAQDLKNDRHVSSDQFAYPQFDGNSFWYKKIPRNAKIHLNSPALSQEFARQVRTYYGYIGINYGDYSAPVYTVTDDVHLVDVAQWDCWKNGFADQKLIRDMKSVPIPVNALPAGGTDAEMVVFEPATDTMWEFWNMRKVAGNWQACWGGRMKGVSKNKGIWQHPYGAAATGLPFAAGQIRVSELRKGKIEHVVGISLVDVEAGIVSWPANRSDGYNPKKSPNWIPEGARLRIDPNLDLKPLKLHPIAQAIAEAGQTYGFVVWDRAGSVSLRAENPRRYQHAGLQSPYPPLFGETPVYSIMDRFPWDKMQFMPFDYGRE